MTEPKKKTGGQPGNQNAAKSASPTITRLLGGQPVPLETEDLRDLAKQIVAPYIEDLGGEENVGTGHRILLSGLTDLVTARLALVAEMAKRGPILKDQKTSAWDLQPGLQRLGHLVSVEARVIRMLGLRRKARKISDLESYIKSKQKKMAGKETK